MTKLCGFVLFVAVAWGVVVYVTLTTVYGRSAPDWTLLPSFFGGMALGLWAFFFGFQRWVD